MKIWENKFGDVHLLDAVLDDFLVDQDGDRVGAQIDDGDLMVSLSGDDFLTPIERFEKHFTEINPSYVSLKRPSTLGGPLTKREYAERVAMEFEDYRNADPERRVELLDAMYNRLFPRGGEEK